MRDDITYSVQSCRKRQIFTGRRVTIFITPPPPMQLSKRICIQIMYTERLAHCRHKGMGNELSRAWVLKRNNMRAIGELIYKNIMYRFGAILPTMDHSLRP